MYVYHPVVRSLFRVFFLYVDRPLFLSVLRSVFSSFVVSFARYLCIYFCMYAVPLFLSFSFFLYVCMYVFHSPLHYFCLVSLVRSFFRCLCIDCFIVLGVRQSLRYIYIYIYICVPFFLSVVPSLFVISLVMYYVFIYFFMCFVISLFLSLLSSFVFSLFS